MERVENRTHTLSAGPEALDHIIAHDLTNHLTIVRGVTDLLLDEVDDPDTIDRLETIRRQTTAATSLLQTISGMARSGTQEEFHSVDVDEVLSIEIDRIQSAYPDASISTDVDDHVRARADGLLTSVFANLLENSIKHNDTQTPTISVTAKSRDGKAIVTVEDNGAGFPVRARDQLLGRGLAHPRSGVHIIRSMVERYGGSISVQESSEGTKVSVEIPGVHD